MGGLLPRARAGAKAKLDEVYAMFPRLAERHGQAAGTLSGGEQQMLAIGRCLMGNPELIMFDEPSLGLAPLVVQEVLHSIRSLNEKGMTILLIEHVMRAVMALAGNVVVLHHGEIIASGAPAEVVRDPAVLECYLGEETVV